MSCSTLRIHQTLLLTSDYHLFRSMQHTLSNTHFQSVDEIQKWLDNFIVSKDTAFFRDGIRQLPERWLKVIKSNGEFIFLLKNLF